MKTHFSTLAIALLLSLSAGAYAQSYSIDWFKVAGGGGNSTNGQYSLSGTVGQQDAGGPMTNGQFSVTGGFWVLPQSIQITGAPVLAIAPALPGTATISWSPNMSGFVLQESWTLSPANWTNSPSGSANPATVSTLNGAKFFRLSKQ